MLSGGKFASLSSSEPTIKPPNHSPGDGILRSVKGRDSMGDGQSVKGVGRCVFTRQTHRCSHVREHNQSASVQWTTRSQDDQAPVLRGVHEGRIPKSQGKAHRGDSSSLFQDKNLEGQGLLFSGTEMFSPSETQVQVRDPEERKGGCTPALPDPTLPSGGFRLRLTGHQS